MSDEGESCRYCDGTYVEHHTGATVCDSCTYVVELPKEMDKFVRIMKGEHSQNTANHYRHALQTLIEYIDAEELDSWEEMIPDDISLLKGFWKDRGLTNLTNKRYAEKLAIFFERNEREDLEERMRGLEFETTGKRSEAKSEDVIYLRKEHYMAMLNHLEKPVEELIIRLLWETGVRRKEATTIRISNINRDKQIIKVNSLKGGKPRSIPYSDEFKTILRDWLDYGKRERFNTSDSEYLIINQHATQVTAGWINDIVRRVADRAGVTEKLGEDSQGRTLYYPTAHNFRSAYASYRIDNGMSLKKVSKLLGHKNLETTTRYVGVINAGLRTDNEKFRPKTFDEESELMRHAYKGLDG